MGKELFPRVDPRKWVDSWIRGQLAAIGPEILSSSGVDIMTKLICVEPELRLTAQDALRHPWIDPVLAEEAMTSLARRGGKFEITEEIMKPVPENEKSAEEVMMHVVVDRTGGDTKITSTAAETIFEEFDKDVISHLINQKNKNIIIDFRVVNAVAKDKARGNEVMLLLLDREGEDINITSAAIQTIFEVFGKDVISHLIKRKGKDIVIDFNLANAVAKKARGNEVMILLLDREGEDINITSTAIQTIFEEFDKDVISHLIKQKGKDIVIDFKLANAVAKKAGGREVMMLLLDRKGEDIDITSTAIQTIFEVFDKNVISHLIKRKGKDIVIDFKLANAVAKKAGGREVMLLLLDWKGEDIDITSTAAETIFEEFDKDVAIRLITRMGKNIKITWKMVKAASKKEGGKEVIMLLRDRKSDFEISPDAETTISEYLAEKGIAL
jgi:hypothetical protein